MNMMYWGYNPLILTFDPNFQRVDAQVGIGLDWIGLEFHEPSIRSVG